jgi:translation elongation factor EF-1alpha
MESKIGVVTHFYPKPSAAVLKLSDSIKVGDQIHIHGHTTHITQAVTSLQIDHKEVESAKMGDDVALLVVEPVREGDEVFLTEG